MAAQDGRDPTWYTSIATPIPGDQFGLLLQWCVCLVKGLSSAQDSQEAEQQQHDLHVFKGGLCLFVKCVLWGFLSGLISSCTTFFKGSLHLRKSFALTFTKELLCADHAHFWCQFKIKTFKDAMRHVQGAHWFNLYLLSQKIPEQTQFQILFLVQGLEASTLSNDQSIVVVIAFIVALHP
jgi:hypothetical protein